MNWASNLRINRQTYWTILLPAVMLMTLAILYLPRPPGLAEAILIGLGVPRLHDIGRSGWWIAIPIVAEFAAIVAGLALGGVQGILIAGGIFVLLCLLAMIVIGLIAGDPESNAYGPPPPKGFSIKRPQPA